MISQSLEEVKALAFVDERYVFQESQIHDIGCLCLFEVLLI